MATMPNISSADMSSYDPVYDTLTGLPLASQQVASALLTPCFIGWSLHSFLCGIVLSNFYHYIKRGLFSRDKTHIKIAVVLVVAGDVAITTINLVENNYWGSTQYRSAANLATSIWIDTLPTLISPGIGLIVQSFFAHRSYKLIKSRRWKAIWAVCIGLSIAFSFAAGIATFASYARYLTNTVEAGLPLTYANCLAAWFLSATVVDVANSGVLCFLLYSKIAGFNKNTDNILFYLIRLAIQTASYTAIVALATTILDFVLNPNSYLTEDISFATWIPIPSLYALSLFTTLSARDTVAPAQDDSRATGVGIGGGTGMFTASWMHSATPVIVSSSPHPTVGLGVGSFSTSAPGSKFGGFLTPRMMESGIGRPSTPTFDVPVLQQGKEGNEKSGDEIILPVSRVGERVPGISRSPASSGSTGSLFLDGN
ncbi:hypothetical protein T439DRAFT_377055 [Meredithblackwellia eburnea MCA 4105]